MSGVLLFLVIGVVAGSLLGWLAARRALPRPGPVPRPPADDLPGGGSPESISGVPAEASFDPLAYALVERCALRVSTIKATSARSRSPAAWPPTRCPSVILTT